MAEGGRMGERGSELPGGRHTPRRGDLPAPSSAALRAKAPPFGYVAPLHSPLISNIYLHEVLDKWFVESVQPACQGKTFMVRYADDFVMGFERLEDVHKVQRVIAKRFARFGLEINTEKTRLVRFGRPSQIGGTGDKPETFDFLGFTHYLGEISEGQSGGEEENCGGAVPTDAASDQGMGDGKPSPAHERAAAKTQRKAAWP